MNPLDKLTTIISELMGKEPSDPDVLKAVVEVVMAIRVPSKEMLESGIERMREWSDVSEGNVWGSPADLAYNGWLAMIDALLTEGEG